MTDEIAIIATLSALAALVLLAYRNRRSRQQSEAEVNAWKLRLQQDLKQARDERNRLLDALGDAFLLVDSEANIRFANQAARALFGNRSLLNRPVSEAFLDPRQLGLVEHVVIQQVFKIPVDDGQRRPQLVRGIGHEILADLFDLVLGGHVTDDDSGVGRAIGGGNKLRGIDDPGVDATGFKIAAG